MILEDVFIIKGLSILFGLIGTLNDFENSWPKFLIVFDNCIEIRVPGDIYELLMSIGESYNVIYFLVNI